MNWGGVGDGVGVPLGGWRRAIAHGMQDGDGGRRNATQGWRRGTDNRNPTVRWRDTLQRRTRAIGIRKTYPQTPILKP